MTVARTATRKKAGTIHRWIRRGFLVWAVFATGWLANSVRTQGLPDALLRSTPDVRVVETSGGLELQPAKPNADSALVFLCGSGIHPHAYVPLLRPIAESGFPVFVVGLPYRFAPLPQHREEAIRRVQERIADHSEVPRWVVAGHSLGGKLAAVVALRNPNLRAAFVLIGTTHPRDDDLSKLTTPFTKVYATRDGVAPVAKIEANRRLLPPHTKWVEIEGGNHSQFGHYGHQLFDGQATIGREAQQTITREALLASLGRVR